jgi:hypothetical protein
MSKFLRSLTDGSLRCKYCGDKECNCMEDGMTTIRIIGCWEFPDSPWSILVPSNWNTVGLTFQDVMDKIYGRI